jgi:hypothetical protein
LELYTKLSPKSCIKAVPGGFSKDILVPSSVPPGPTSVS